MLRLNGDVFMEADAYYTNYEESKSTNGRIIVGATRTVPLTISNHAATTLEIVANKYKRIGTNT